MLPASFGKMADRPMNDRQGTGSTASYAVIQATGLRGVAAPHRLRNLAGDRRGAALVEFTLILPLLVTLAIGIVQFGLLLNGYIMLTDATAAGARKLAVSRGGNTPYTDARTQVQTAAARLTAASLTITLAVNGTNCGNDATCKTALTSAQGQPASVTTSYPCSLLILFSGFALAPTCTLGSSMTERVE